MSRFPLPQPAPGRIQLAPSLLAADFSCLRDEVQRVENAGADMLHLDVMDGHFVPNLTIGPALVQALRRVCSLPFDVHLMLDRPELLLGSFVAAGADAITIHVEAACDVAATLAAIRAAGCAAGLSLRPRTSAHALLPYLAAVDLLLVMTVEPGYGGQAFMADQVPKIRELRKLIAAADHPIHLQVDGGITAETATQVVEAGADLLVAGTSVFRHPRGVVTALRELRKGKNV